MASELRFEGDEAKARANARKHGVSFDGARSAFADERGLLLHDPDHSEEEDRLVLLGLGSSLRTLVVCHCYRQGNAVIRSISARRANRMERAQYEEAGR